MNICGTHSRIIAECGNSGFPYEHYKKIVTRTPFTPLTKEQFQLAFDDMFMVTRCSDSLSRYPKKRKVNKTKLKELANQLILLASQVLEELER